MGLLGLPAADYKPLTAELELQLRSGEVLTRKIDFVSGKRIIYTLFSQGQSNYRIILSPLPLLQKNGRQRAATLAKRSRRC